MIQLPIQLAETLDLDPAKPVVYIAGKVTGLPYGEVFAKFSLAKAELQAQGYNVLNPCDVITETCEWFEAMRTSVMLLASADHICLLPDWHESNGAKLERDLAIALGITTIEL